MVLTFKHHISVGDFYIKNNYGYHITVREPSGTSIKTFLSDISTIRMGIYGEYVFNADRFSYRASFIGSEAQKKSAGGLLLGFGSFYNKFNYRDKDRPQLNKSIENIQLGPSIGYAYTLVFKNHLFITAGLGTGVNINFYNTGSKIEDFDYQELNPYMHIRAGIGYHSDSWSILGNILSNNTRSGYSDEDTNDKIGFNDLSAQITFFKRFHYENKLLSKITNAF